MDTPVLQCAVCNKPVDRLDSWYDAARMTQVFVAHCHGAEQRVELDDRQLANAGPDGVTFSRAFEAPALPALEHQFVTAASVGLGTGVLANAMVCRRCGAVRQRDGKNSPCRGQVRVALRGAA